MDGAGDLVSVAVAELGVLARVADLVAEDDRERGAGRVDGDLLHGPEDAHEVVLVQLRLVQCVERRVRVRVVLRRASTSISKTAARRTLPPRKRATVLPIVCAALSIRFSPTARPTATVVPIASPTIITVSICMTCEPIETAVTEAVESNCPMIKRSAIP